MIEGFPDVLGRAKRGDEQAIAVLWRATNPGLLRYLRGRNPEIAEDVASDTWLAVAEGLAGFDGGEPEFRGWVFTIARNRLIDRHRVADRHPTEPSEDADLEDRLAPDDPEQDTLDVLDTDAALRLVRQLPPDQADVILLRVIAGLDTARVAAMLGKQPGAIRVLQHRGLRALARMLEALGRGTGILL